VTWTTLVGAGALVVDADKLLMIRQRRPYGVHWEMPSGYYEPAESLEQAAAREVLEETGVTVEVVELVCTLVWERQGDRRRNVLAWFAATRIGDDEPRAQAEEGIEEAAFVDPATLEALDVHPLCRAALEPWWHDGRKGFHVAVEVAVRADGSQEYAFRT